MTYFKSCILVHFGELDVMCDLVLCCVLCEIVSLGKWHIGTYCLALPMNAWTLCMKCVWYVNSVTRLCLHLKDTAYNLTCHLTCVDG